MKLPIFIVIFAAGITSQAQSVEVIKFPELQKKILNAEAPLTIFNFWATWCGPCVREIPHFESYVNNDKVKVYLVSLDFIDDLEKVKKFVTAKNYKSTVLLLNESDYDSYMSKVSKEWSGAIPATLFVDEWGKTYFHEKELKKEELDALVAKYVQ